VEATCPEAAPSNRRAIPPKQPRPHQWARSVDNARSASCRFVWGGLHYRPLRAFFFGRGFHCRPGSAARPPKNPRTRPSRAPCARGVHAPIAHSRCDRHTPALSSRRRTGRRDPRRRRTRHPSCLRRSLEEVFFTIDFLLTRCCGLPVCLRGPATCRCGIVAGTGVPRGAVWPSGEPPRLARLRLPAPPGA
jgi:hypothetical protein